VRSGRISKSCSTSGYSADVIAPFGVLDAKVRFLSKPFMRDDLARNVREVLDEQTGMSKRADRRR